MIGNINLLILTYVRALMTRVIARRNFKMALMCIICIVLTC